MNSYSTYTLVLCILVFVILTAVLGIMFGYIVKLTVKGILHGLDDEKIIKQFNIEKDKKKSRASKVISLTISIFGCVVVLGVFVFAMILNLSPVAPSGKAPKISVVNSASMSYKNLKNEWLFENELDDQFDTFDLVLTYKLPEEDELKLYDIVVYEVDDTLVMHRIVGIEEPNDKHTDERWFVLQGDAVENSDRFPVRYEQMRSIYRGEKVSKIGSLVSFLQSPAGYMCMVLLLMYFGIMPIIEKRINTATTERLIALGFITKEVDSKPVLETIPVEEKPSLIERLQNYFAKLRIKEAKEEKEQLQKLEQKKAEKAAKKLAKQSAKKEKKQKKN